MVYVLRSCYPAIRLRLRAKNTGINNPPIFWKGWLSLLLLVVSLALSSLVLSCCCLLICVLPFVLSTWFLVLVQAFVFFVLPFSCFVVRLYFASSLSSRLHYGQAPIAFLGKQVDYIQHVSCLSLFSLALSSHLVVSCRVGYFVLSGRLCQKQNVMALSLLHCLMSLPCILLGERDERADKEEKSLLWQVNTKWIRPQKN
jgi:hypothetical protein